MARRAGSIRGRLTSSAPGGIFAGPVGEFMIDFGASGEAGVYALTSDLGMVDSKVGTVSFWFFLPSSGGSLLLMNVDSSNVVNGRFVLQIDTSERITISSTLTAGGNAISFTSETAQPLDGNRWHHVLCSWDTAQDVFYCYANDIDVWTNAASNVVTLDSEIEYSSHSASTRVEFAGGDFIGAPLQSGMAVIWFDTEQFIDITIEDNRRKFIGANQMPVALGPDGSLPTGTSPQVYLDNPLSTFHRNRGTEEDFTVFGTPANWTGNDIVPVGGSAGPAGIYAVDFQPTGSEGGITRSKSVMSNLTNSKEGLISLWFNYQGSGEQVITAFDRATVNPLFELKVTAAMQIALSGLAGSVTPVAITFLSDPATLVEVNTWHHFMAAWNTNTSTFTAYLDGTDIYTNADTLTVADEVIAWARNASDVWEIGGGGNITTPWEGYMAQIYVQTEETLDLTVAANRALFITAAGGPVALGITGMTPTGTRPMVYFDNPAADFNISRGIVGNFTVTGSLDDAATNPAGV